MNYLAHLLLAADKPELMVGGLLGDFLRGMNPNSYSEEIQDGVRLHQAIDQFTDEHPTVQRSKNRLQPPYRRYAGVLVDVFYDHFLAANWIRYSPAASLEEFSQQAYAVLADHETILPPRLRRMLPYMIEENWLTSYRTLDGIDRTLTRLSRRLKRQNPLPRAVIELDKHYAGLKSDFIRFFPELTEFVKQSVGPPREENAHEPRERTA